MEQRKTAQDTGTLSGFCVPLLPADAFPSCSLKDTDFEREKLVFLEKRQEHRRRIQLQEEEQAASQAAV